MLSEHLEEGAVWKFLHAELSEAEAALTRSHLDECAECRVLVTTLARGITPASDNGDEATLFDPDAVPPRESLKMSWLTDSVVAGKYRVEEPLGCGGMGYVVAATHLELGTRLALKLLRPEVLATEGARSRFLREARTAAQLKSRHVVQVFDVGTLPNGAPFLVMELLKGRDLRAELKARGALPVAEAVRYALEACQALSIAHQSGIVHRDIKPANIFLAEEAAGRTVKLLDFGTSKWLDPQDDPALLTQPGTWAGTPRYMAPEQLKLGHTVDERSDIWALGVVLYELVVGAAPFRAASLEELSRAVLELPPNAIDAQCPAVPADLAATIARCLEKDPARRFPSAEALALALAKVDVSSADVANAMVSTAGALALARDVPSRAGRVPRGRRAGALLLAGLALVGSLAWFRAVRTSTHPEAPTAVASRTAAALGAASGSVDDTTGPSPATSTSPTQRSDDPSRPAVSGTTPHPRLQPFRNAAAPKPSPTQHPEFGARQ